MPRDSTLQTLILAGERHHEIPRLRVEGASYAKSDKLNPHPLAKQSRRDHGALAPGRDLHQRKGRPQLQGEQLHQGIRRATNLHPQFQGFLRLLPQIGHTPPALQVAEQGLDTPTRGIDLHYLLPRQLRLCRQYQPWARPCAIVQVHLTPDRPYRESLQKPGHRDHRADSDPLQLAVQPQFHLLRRQPVAQGGIDPLPVLAFRSPPLRLRFRRQAQDRIPPHLSDDPYPLFEHGQDQTLAHEPGIDQQARLRDVISDRVDQLPGHPELAALAGFLDQPGANRHRQGRPQPNSHHQGQGHPALAVHEGRPIGLLGVVVLDTDARPNLRRAGYQRIVDDQIHYVGREHRLHQLQQANGQIDDRDMRPLDQLVIGGPVRFPANRPDGAGDPAFRVEQATDQEFDEGTPGTGWHGRQKERNPLREQQANRGGKRHEGVSERENSSLVAAQIERHVKLFLHFLENIFRGTRMPSASYGDRQCLNFS